MARHGYNPIQSDEDFSLPNANTGYSANFTYVGASNGKQRLLVIAQTEVSIATGQAMSIEFMAGSTANPTTGPKAENHIYLQHKTNADGTLTFAIGAVIVDYVLPEGQLDAGDYFRLLFTTDANESSEDVDILLVGWGD